MSVVTPALVLPAGFRVSVAPMMDWTDRHCRSFHRLLSRRAWLYTEMVTAQAIAHGDLDHLLGRGEEGDRVVLHRSADSSRFLHPPGYSYYATLRTKLNWHEIPGLEPRRG